MADKLRNKSFVIVVHKLYHGVADDFKKYLIDNKCKNLLFIAHEFASRKPRRSYIELYKEGKKIGVYYSRDYSFLPEVFINFKDLLYTFFWLLFKVKKTDFYFGFGGINVICGCILKKFKGIKKVIFYTIDYAPLRFKNPFLNKIYHWFDKYALQHSFETWNLSPRMAEGRERVRGLKKEDYPNQKVVPVGVWFDRIKRFNFFEINKTELIFVGHLLEKQGIQIVLKAIPEIIKTIPSFKFRIIGSGKYEDRLKELVKELQIESYVILEGSIYNQNVVNEKLAKAALAVAMYDRNTENLTYYADSTKLKTYLACSLPVLLTDVPYNAKEIENRKCGKVIDYNKGSIAQAVVKFMKDESRLKKYRENAVDYASQFNWNLIFKNNLNRIL